MNKKRYRKRYSTKERVIDFYKVNGGLPKRRKRLFIKLKVETFNRNKNIMTTNVKNKFMSFREVLDKACKGFVKCFEKYSTEISKK